MLNRKGDYDMNIKLNLSSLMNFTVVLFILILVLMSAGCSYDPHGLRHKTVIYYSVINTGECGSTLSVARCNYLIRR